MLKILHMIDSGGFYGAEVVILTLMEESTRMGLFPMLGSMGALGENEKPIETEALRRGLSLRRFRMRTLPGLPSIRGILRTIRDEGIDLVHSHGYKANVLFGFLPRSLRPFPVVTTLHGWCSTDRFSKLRLYEWLDSRALASLDGVAVVSAKMLAHPRLSGRRLDHLSVIPNAAAPVPSMSRTADNSDPIVAFCRRIFTFGSIGRLSTEKNFVSLLKSFTILLDRGLDVQLLIVGEGPERPVLDEFIEQHGLAERVMLPGYITDARRYLPDISAYVLSSTTEGMPISILDALAAGIPIVSTAVGEVPEMLEQGHAGLLVQPGDVPSLATAMDNVFADANLRKQLADAARRASEKQYSAQTMTRSYIEFYQRALKTRGMEQEPSTGGFE